MTKNPDLCKEWNDSRSPEDFMEFSNEKVSWKCSHCEHKWSASIAHRSNGEGCPRCKKHHQTSVNEVAIPYRRPRTWSTRSTRSVSSSCTRVTAPWTCVSRTIRS
ncbi:MAG: zinc-ribbon domain-containing protein [Candidatus Methanomethylophilaceae archaeon]|nr:zinc-ribbon domain-containing protein [Candidatus Methanomethylophilaceae archaeon]